MIAKDGKRGIARIGVVLLATTLLAGCISLKGEGAKSGRLIGTWVDDFNGFKDPKYIATLDQFNLFEVFTEWKWTEPENDQWQFDRTDGLFGVAKQRGVAKGRFFFNADDTPDYLSKLTTAQLRDELKNHIQTFMKRYPFVRIWQVMNEPLGQDADGNFIIKHNVFQQKLGSDWIREALQFAYEADPMATFIAVNEFNADGMNPKADKLYAYYKNTLVGAIPSSHLAVGLQMHLDPCAGGFRSPPASEIERNMKRFADLGIQVQITEMDYAIRCLPGTYDQRLQTQQAMYHDVVAACYRLAACTAFSTWGIGDKDSWIRTNNNHTDWPLLFDDNYLPKPAYQGVVDALNGR